MKHRLYVLIALLLMIVFLTIGCSPSSEKQYLAICGSYAVPGMRCSDLKDNSYECKVLEKDLYGRILYSFHAPNIISKQSESAVVICQKIEKDAVWYYEDICYLLSSASDDDIAHLKEVNDWEEPMDCGKMVYRSCKVTLDGYISSICALDFYDLKEVFCHNINVTEEQIIDSCFLDANNNGLSLYWFTVGNDLNTSCYFVLADEEYQIITCQVEGDLESIPALVAFKNENGW